MFSASTVAAWRVMVHCHYAERKFDVCEVIMILLSEFHRYILNVTTRLILRTACKKRRR